MILITNAIINEYTVMIKTFYTFTTGIAMFGGSRFDTSAKKAKVASTTFNPLI